MAPKRKAPLPLWHVDHQFQRVNAAYETGRGRKHRGGAHPATLGELLGQEAFAESFYEAHTADAATLPAEADPARPGRWRLDMRRVTQARGDSAALGTLTVFRHGLCQAHDLAAKLRGLDDQALCRGDWGRVNMQALVGGLLPLHTTMYVDTKRPQQDGDVHARKFAPLGPHGGPHAFAFKPALLVAMTDTKRRDATADVMAAGYIVSPRLFNVLGDDGALGLPLGDRVHAGYQATLYYFLVVHAPPPPGLPLKMGAANPLDQTLWRWADWAADFPDRLPRTGLSDLTMHGGAIWRAVLQTPIADVAAELRELEEAGELEAMLLSEPVRERGRPLAGLVVRKQLLVRHLLRGTPMDFLLEHGGQPGQELLEWDVPLPPGPHPGKALYDELRRWAADPAFAAWF